MISSNPSISFKLNLEGELEVNEFSKKILKSNYVTELTLFENIARHREVPKIDTIKLSYSQIDRIIKEVLSCSICLQIYSSPVNIKTCLHKFCRTCIETYTRTMYYIKLKKRKRECGICRTSIETRRLLRDDFKISNIITCIIPEIKLYNQIEEKYFNHILPRLCHKSKKEDILDINIKKVPQDYILSKVSDLISIRFIIDKKKQFACHSMPQTTLGDLAKFLSQKVYLQYNKSDNKINFYIIKEDDIEINLNHSLTINLLKEKYGNINKDFINIHLRMV